MVAATDNRNIGSFWIRHDSRRRKKYTYEPPGDFRAGKHELGQYRVSLDKWEGITVREYGNLTRMEMEAIDRKNTIVLIPIGALEQHGNQLPLATDDIIAEETVAYIDRELDADFPILLFPLMPLGVSTEHMHFCGTVSLRPDTLYRMLYDICTSLAQHGFVKIALLISHGSNIFQVLSRELRSELGIGVFLINLTGLFGKPEVAATISPGNVFDFHGGEMETSMVMAARPGLVKLDTAVSGKPVKYEGNKVLSYMGPISLGWIADEWRAADGNPIGIGGDPRGATAEKGEIIFQSFARYVAQGLREIAAFDCSV